jgi:Transposase IS4
LKKKLKKISADYELGGGDIRRTCLPLQSVKAEQDNIPIPPPATATNAAVAGISAPAHAVATRTSPRLPIAVAIDRKPENGCEIQNCACGATGVMLQLKIVKCNKLEEANLIENEYGLLHGTAVLKQLIRPWFYTQRIVCADSFFASVGCAEELLCHQTRFTGVVDRIMYYLVFLSGYPHVKKLLKLSRKSIGHVPQGAMGSNPTKEVLFTWGVFSG